MGPNKAVWEYDSRIIDQGSSKREARVLIPILAPKVPSFETLRAYLEKIDANGIYSNFGPLNENLQERLARYFGIPSGNIVTLCNATLAIQAAIETAPSQANHWECPAWTFTATASAILQAKRGIRFSDIDDEWRVAPSGISRALVDVLPFGAHPNFQRLNYSKLDCVVVDAAASFPALQYVYLPPDIPVGVVVSMHATKTFPAGEGGIFFSNDPDWVQRVKNWSNFGMTQTRISYFLGSNAKLSEYSAAVALASLDAWDETSRLYKSKALLARQKSSNLGLQTYSPTDDFFSSYWILRELSPDIVNKLEMELSKRGIAWRHWWEKGCHKMPAYSHYIDVDLSQTDNAAATSIGLPFFPDMSDANFNDIEEAIYSCLL